MVAVFFCLACCFRPLSLVSGIFLLLDVINECAATPPKCAAPGQRCTNNDGSYRCSCISPRQQLNEDESACIGMYTILNGPTNMTCMIMSSYN